MDKNKKYTITGGTGYIGEALVERLYKDGYINLVVVSRNEGKLVMLRNKFPEIEIVCGDIADKFIAQKACQGVSGIFHVAAQKFLDLGEDQPRQCVLTNVVGTINLLDQTVSPDMDFIVGVSTDKTVQVSNVYAATKLLFEKLFVEYHWLNLFNTKYRLVRFGNVIYSTGSVLSKWRDSLLRGEPIKVTDFKATRFFWTVDEAVDLILSAIDSPSTIPTFRPMKSICIGDLVSAMVSKYGGEERVSIKEIGLQPGESLHEKIDDSLPDSSSAERFTQEEIMKII